MIKLSFIIPTYNRQELLPETVDSILQSIKVPSKSQLEIIIVDDKSTDGTLDFIKKKYKNLISKKLISIVELDINLGVVAARNAGAIVATGNWLVFLDSDDLLVSGGLQVIRQEILKYKWVDAIFFSCIDFSGNIIGTKFKSQRISLKSYERNSMYGEKLPVIKKDVFVENQYDNDLRGFEGLTYFRMLIGGYNLWISSKVARKYRVNTPDRLSATKSLLNRADKMALGFNRIILEYRKISCRAPFKLYLKAILYRLIAYLYPGK